MASSLSHLFHLQNLLKIPSVHTLCLSRNPHNILCLPSLSPAFLKRKEFGKTLFAITESGSPNSVDPDPQSLLLELSDSFVLPGDFFSKMPRDLRLDLNDAAFDLSNGPVKDECGEELGETLLNISQAWESADASTSAALVGKLPGLLGRLTNNNKSALGKRLISAGRRFQALGQYGKGEGEMIAKAMIKAGKLLSATAATNAPNAEPKQETRTFKVHIESGVSLEANSLSLGIEFGELQVALTSDKAYIGAAIAFVFGILSWELSQGVQSIPESSLQYANDNALMLAKSLRGALLVILYSSAVLSAFATGGLILLGGQLGSKDK